MIPLTVHAPNLAHRTDRRAHLEAQFAGKPEFRLMIEPVVPNAAPSLSLWLTFQRIVRQERDAGSDLFIFCEDDHQFTPSYDRDRFFAHVAEAARQGAHILLGGIGGFGHWVPVGRNRFWTD